jgi:lipopolysaccharide/colanic/teichoic acid biosynthesis glycosyltransferase
MSLVGPDPLLPIEAARCPDHLRRRFAVRPGFASLWEISGDGRALTWHEIEMLNVRYVEHWSLLLDLRIIRKAFRGHGPG